MMAGEIATTLDIPPNNLSFSSKSHDSRKNSFRRAKGRFQRYRANIPMMLDMITYLTEECCDGNPEQCESMSMQHLSLQETRLPLNFFKG